ncbi:MAG: NAD(P)-binding domain-containing protein [Mycobacteriales bacterium]
MKIGILGTGTVGRALAAASSDLGHDVQMGTRDIEATLARPEPEGYGASRLGPWLEQQPKIRLVTFAEAARHAELVVNATNGAASLDALNLCGAENLAGKVILDVANPLDFSAGMPPTLLVKDTDSLAEQIQRAFPDARVVKSLNTMNAGVMVAPGALAGADHSVFLSGDDADAKSTVANLLREFGWVDIVDLGEITTARGVEMVLPLWLRLMGVVGAPSFNFKIVRATGD